MRSRRAHRGMAGRIPLRPGRGAGPGHPDAPARADDRRLLGAIGSLARDRVPRRRQGAPGEAVGRRLGQERLGRLRARGTECSAAVVTAAPDRAQHDDPADVADAARRSRRPRRPQRPPVRPNVASGTRCSRDLGGVRTAADATPPPARRVGPALVRRPLPSPTPTHADRRSRTRSFPSNGRAHERAVDHLDLRIRPGPARRFLHVPLPADDGGLTATATSSILTLLPRGRPRVSDRSDRRRRPRRFSPVASTVVRSTREPSPETGSSRRRVRRDRVRVARVRPGSSPAPRGLTSYARSDGGREALYCRQPSGALGRRLRHVPKLRHRAAHLRSSITPLNMDDPFPTRGEPIGAFLSDFAPRGGRILRPISLRAVIPAATMSLLDALDPARPGATGHPHQRACAWTASTHRG